MHPSSKSGDSAAGSESTRPEPTRDTRANCPTPACAAPPHGGGYDLGHRARQIREEDFDRFDMIVVMDDMNYENVHRLAPSRRAAEKIFRMREFFRRHPRWDHVPDPYYEGAEGFELVLDMLEDGCGGILEYLENPQ